MTKFILLLFFTCGLSMAQSQEKKQPFFTKSLTGETVKDIKAATTGGNISVTGTSQTESRVEVYVSPNNGKANSLTKEEIQKRLDEEYELSVSVVNNKLSVIAKPKNKNMNWKRALNISFYVFVTKDVSSDLTTSGGNIKLQGVSGTHHFTTSGGNLHVDNATGKIAGKTSGGNIHLSNSKDDIELTTSGGNIDAENSEGRIKLITSGGSVSLKKLKGNIKATTSGGNIDGELIGEELTANTSGGNVSLRGLSCNLETSTSGGNIDVEMKELVKHVKITNSSGTIDLQLPGGKGIDLKMEANKIKTTTLDHFSGELKENRIDGKLNGGGVLVRVKGGSGDINLVLVK